MTATVTLLADQAIDIDQMMLEGVDTSGGPLYSISEMAQFFFARSSHWVRWLESCHYSTGKGKEKKECGIRPSAHTKKQREEHQHTWKFMLDGNLLEAQRTSSGARKYDLALVEKIAHALASNGTIEVNQLRQALLIVKIQAEMHGYL